MLLRVKGPLGDLFSEKAIASLRGQLRWPMNMRSGRLGSQSLQRKELGWVRELLGQSGISSL